MHEAKTHLSKLVERAERGEEIVLTRRGTPAVRLVPVAPRRTMASVRGMLGGQVRIADDFDDLDAMPDEFKDAFGLR